MKSILVLSTLMLSFNPVQAESVHLTSADGSDLSALCVAAASSDRPVAETAWSYGISRNEMNEIRCNGIALDQFADKYRVKAPLAARALVLKKSDDSDLTELCYRALSSFEQYQQLLNQRRLTDANLQSELACNGMPVIDFVSRYRRSADAVATSLQ